MADQSNSGTALTSIGSDPDAFEAFYRAHVDVVMRFVARRVRDPQVVADLTVEVFMAAIDAARSAAVIRGEPAAWLYGVARNVINAERRRQGSQRRAMDRLTGRRPLTEDDIGRLVDRIDAEARARSLYEAMDVLPDHERRVLELVALDGLTVQEAAEVLGIRAGTARVRLHRARGRMKDHLGFGPITLVDSTTAETAS